MRREIGKSLMKKSAAKIGEGMIRVTACGLLLVGMMILPGCSDPAERTTAQSAVPKPEGFDHQGEKIFDNYDAVPLTYLTGDSGDRNLSVYYSRRQYPGSPPMVPHPVLPSFGGEAKCLSCHAKGGWSEEYAKNTPLTPHPEFEACRQCHLRPQTTDQFVGNDWKSVVPPKLGRSQLAGSPPPIPHTLQLRGNCIACHTGPGAVVEIRVEHASRGNCRQCHVPLLAPPFKRNA